MLTCFTLDIRCWIRPLRTQYPGSRCPQPSPPRQDYNIVRPYLSHLRMHITINTQHPCIPLCCATFFPVSLEHTRPCLHIQTTRRCIYQWLYPGGSTPEPSKSQCNGKPAVLWPHIATTSKEGSIREPPWGTIAGPKRSLQPRRTFHDAHHSVT
jgi:hypothetical protein